MKIAINALFFQHPATGSGQYMTHLLHALAEIDQHNDYVLLGPRPLAASVSTTFPYHVQPVPAFARKTENIEKIVWEQFTAPLAAHQAGVDLLHIPYFAPPLLPRTATVVTIHDIIQWRVPGYLPNRKIKAYMQLVARAIQHTTSIITVSEHAKQDIVAALKLPPERIHVIYEAAGDEYQPVTDPATLATTRARYGLGERYIFYLGGMERRKNLLQLVRAFAQLVAQLDDPNLQLFISGNPNKFNGSFFPDPRPLAAELGITERIVYRFVEEEDKPSIYSGASLFVFPSLYEGFGLPPLEAMSCGAPVVCSNRTSLPEVVGEAALSVDPDNTHELAEAMQRILTDNTLRADLQARSLQRAGQFNWRKTAAETLAVYEEVLASRKR